MRFIQDENFRCEMKMDIPLESRISSWTISLQKNKGSNFYQEIKAKSLALSSVIEFKHPVVLHQVKFENTSKKNLVFTISMFQGNSLISLYTLDSKNFPTTYIPSNQESFIGEHQGAKKFFIQAGTFEKKNEYEIFRESQHFPTQITLTYSAKYEVASTFSLYFNEILLIHCPLKDDPTRINMKNAIPYMQNYLEEKAKSKETHLDSFILETNGLADISITSEMEYSIHSNRFSKDQSSIEVELKNFKDITLYKPHNKLMLQSMQINIELLECYELCSQTDSPSLYLWAMPSDQITLFLDVNYETIKIWSPMRYENLEIAFQKQKFEIFSSDQKSQKISATDFSEKGVLLTMNKPLKKDRYALQCTGCEFELPVYKKTKVQNTEIDEKPAILVNQLPWKPLSNHSCKPANIRFDLAPKIIEYTQAQEEISAQVIQKKIGKSIQGTIRLTNLQAIWKGTKKETV